MPFVLSSNVSEEFATSVFSAEHGETRLWYRYFMASVIVATDVLME
jgi:hypothetical protein